MTTDMRLTALHVHFNPFGTGHTRFAHAACDHGSVRCLATTTGENALRGEEAVDVLGFGLFTHQDHGPAEIPALHLGAVCVEHRVARRGAGRSRQTLRQRLALERRTQARVQHLFQMFRIDTQQGLFLADQARLRHLHRGPHHRHRVHLAVARLQAIQHAALDRELEVLHLFVVAFEAVTQLVELTRHLGHLVGELVDRFGCADTGDHVFALRVDQILAEQLVFTGTRVARERNAGCGIVATVAEHHRADVDGRAVRHVRRDLELTPVVDGALAHPRAEHRLDRDLQLLERILRKRAPGVVLEHREEALADLLEIVGRQADILFHVRSLLDGLELRIEQFVGHPHRDLAEQLDEASVGVVAETCVACLADLALQCLGIQAEVENRIHHAGHRHRRTTAHRHQQGVVWISKALPRRAFDARHVFAHLIHHVRGDILATGTEVMQTRLGGDDEAGRHVETDLRHLTQVRTLATQQLLVTAVAFRKRVDPLVRTCLLTHLALTSRMQPDRDVG